MKLNEKIYKYRKLNRWSQEELADKLEVSRQTVSKWEVGKAVPELEKLIKLSELFNITVDEFVKENIDIVSKEEFNIANNSAKSDEENLKQEENNVIEKNKKRKKILKIVIILLLILILCILGMLYLQKRKLQIREIAKVYREEFRDDNDNKTIFANEVVYKNENNNITKTYREYYIYREKDKSDLIKIKEYEDEEMNVLKKEIYLDETKRSFSSNADGVRRYDEAIEINIDDWSMNVIKDYEIILPTERIKCIFREKYFDWNRNDAEKELALDLKNDFFVHKNPEIGSNYVWSYGEKNNAKREDFFQIQMLPESSWMFFEMDNYENTIEETREIVNVQLSKIPGNIDDVTVPEL